MAVVGDSVLPAPVTTQNPRTTTKATRLLNLLGVKWLCSRLMAVDTQNLPPSIVDTSSQLESYPQGYPRFSALAASHPSFSIFRRFLVTRMRLLLYKQDEICVLEEELGRIDKSEPCELFLGNRRRDNNQQRKVVMKSLEEKLAEYDEQMERYRTAMSCEKPTARDVASLKSWVYGNASISKTETRFLSHNQDLMSCSGIQDAGVTLVEPLLEDFVIAFDKFLGHKPPYRYSRDENVQIFSSTSVRVWSRSLVAWIAVSLLLVPLGVLYCITSMKIRFMVILLATAAFILTMSFVGRAQTSELLTASACYMAVMVVFVAGNGHT